MKNLVSMLVLLAAVWAPSHSYSGTPAAPIYSYAKPSADGTGKFFMGREIAQVMTYHGADWLERAERVKEERPDLVLRALELAPGSVVADIGAGTGYYARRIAQAIGPEGLVYAVEIQPEMLKRLNRELKLSGISNVKPVLATSSTIPLRGGELDLAVMIDVYHELEQPFETVDAIVRALKPGGRLAFVEFRANDPKVPIKALHTMTEAQIRKEAAMHSLEWERTVSDLPWQHVVVFRKR